MAFFESLQNRLVLLAGGAAIISIWLLAALSNNAYESDLEHQILTQQYQTVHILAAEIDQEIRDRMKMLESIASKVTPSILNNPTAAQAFLRDRYHLPAQFPGGHYLVNKDIVMVGSVPESLAKAGLAYRPDAAMLQQLNEGKSAVSKAVFSKRLNVGVFGIASPVRGDHGKTIGALVGTMDLGHSSFLNRITATHPGNQIRFRLISPDHRQIITATDPILNLHELPSIGVDSVLDKLLDGTLSAVRRTDQSGAATLVSTVKIASSGWLLVSEQSVQDAFSSSSQLQTKVWLWGLVIAGALLALNAWFIRRQLGPIHLASKTLSDINDRGQGWRPLPKPDRMDEVGRLIGGFNQVLTHLFDREEKLKDSESRWKFAIEGAGDGVWDCNLEDGSIFFSRRWKEMIGYQESEISDTFSEWEDRIHPDDRAQTLASWHDYLSGARTSYVTVHRLKIKDSGYRWILARGMIVKRSAVGTPLRVIGTHTDLTDRKEAEVALRSLATSLEEAQKIAKVGSWELDLVSGDLKWSEQIFRLFEIDPSKFEATYEGFLNAIHPDDRASVNLAYSQSLELRTNYEITHRLLMPDGRVKWVNERCVSDFDENGIAIRSRGTVQDVTDSQAKDRALEASRDLLMTIINTVPARVFWKDQDLIYLGCNQRFAEDAGKLSPADVVGRNDFEMGWSAQAELYRDDDRQVLTSGGAKLHYDEPQSNASGQTIWLRTSKVPLRNEEGEILGILGVYDDITAQKETELDLKRHREHLEELVQMKTGALANSVVETQRALALLEQQKYVLEEHALVTITDMAGRITYANRKFVEQSGYPALEILGKDHAFLNSGTHPKGFFKNMFETVARGEAWHAEVCNKRKDGGLIWLDTTVALFKDASGMATEYIAVRTDITERKKAEEAAFAANRAKTDFLANMSHEIRTPMNGVLGVVDQLKHTQLSHEQRGMINTINRSSLALLNILNDILDITKIEADQLKVEFIPTFLRDVVESTVLLMRSSPQNMPTRVCVFVDPSLPVWVVSDPTRLRQILFNLLGNAFKFTDKKRRWVRIEVAPSTSQLGEAKFELRVSDNGIGMDQTLLARLFEPFSQGDASTARRFGGTGLGLSITHHLVELLGGEINVSSTLGVGSNFVITLPLKPAEKPVAEDSEKLPDLKSLSVIAVTASEQTGKCISTYLTFAGARVKVVPNLDLARIEQGREPRSILLLDCSVNEKVTVDIDTLPSWTDPVRKACLVPRDSRIARDKLTTISDSPLLLSDLIQGIATAAGKIERASTSMDFAGSSSVTLRPCPTIEEALVNGQLILMAEDNETNRDVLQAQLNRIGYVCEVACDGEQALQMWRSGRYGLLLTDCQMPNLDGFGLTTQIRAEEAPGKRIPIVAVTAYAMDGEAQRCIDVGMDAYLSKPLSMGALQTTLNEWLPLTPLSHKEPGTGEDSTETKAVEKAPELPVWDDTTLTRLVGNKPELHERLLRKFLLTANDQVNALVAAASTADLNTLHDCAHNLKSAARSVGALILGERCQTIEHCATQGNLNGCLAAIEPMQVAFDAAQSAITRSLGPV